MPSQRYTLTVYVAAAGTPVITDKKQDYSSVGHVYYKISDGSAQGTVGYGFAPAIEGKPIGLGKKKLNEFKEYQNPTYERQLEISPKQYTRLLDFGKNPRLGNFDDTKYNGFTNSCIDFVYAGLRYSGVYNKQNLVGSPDGKPHLVDFNGHIRVGPNIERFEEIQPLSQYRNSNLNTPIEKRRRPEPSCKDAFGEYPNLRDLYKKESWDTIQKRLVCEIAENQSIIRSEDDIQIAADLEQFNLLEQTNGLIAQLQAGNKDALAAFTAQPEIKAAAAEAREEAQMLLRQNPHLADGLPPNRFERPELSDMPEQVQKLYAEGKAQLQGYYQEHGIRYGEEALDNTAMALAEEGYRNRMRSITMISLKDSQVNIGDDTAPDFRMTSVNAREAGLTAGHESMARAQETEQAFAQQAQQREMERMAESRSRGMSMG